MDSHAALGMTKVAERTPGNQNTNNQKERPMKKLIILIALIIPIMAQSATMCSKNDTITIMLDPSIEGTNYTYNTAQSTWTTWFTYGTIRGISACLSSNYGQSPGGAVADLHDSGELVVGGETNGEHCWCKMTHPAASLWVFNHTYGSASACASYCASNCGIDVRYYSYMRSGLFGSIRQ